MTATTAKTHDRRWRMAGWGLLAGLLALPAIAMRFTREVDWTALDFLTMGIMLGALGLGCELVVRASSDRRYRAGMALALVTALLLVWVNLAVGIIGNEDNDANMLFAGVLAVGVGGAWLARVKAAGMAWTMLAVAGAHTFVAGVAMVGGLGAGEPIWPKDVIGTTVIFDGLWLLSGLLFHRAAR